MEESIINAIYIILNVAAAIYMYKSIDIKERPLLAIMYCLIAGLNAVSAFLGLMDIIKYNI